MDATAQKLIREQYNAPENMKDCDRKELVEYIKRLEQGVFELANTRGELYERLWKAENGNS